MEREPLVRLAAALFAEYKAREAVRTPPLEWSSHTALADCRGWDTLSTEKAVQVGGNPRSELFKVGALRLRDVSNAVKE